MYIYHIYIIYYILLYTLGFPGGSAGNKSACNARDLGLIPWVGKIPWRRERECYKKLYTLFINKSYIYIYIYI